MTHNTSESYKEDSVEYLQHLNSLFMSNRVEDIAEFYSNFENELDLIRWMMSRPKGKFTVQETDGDKSVIVVIPTSDFNSPYSMACRTEIFKGIHTIFIESAGVNSNFNYAHNMNMGVKLALKYQPDWIICSNDDMHKIDEPQRLTDSLSKTDPHTYDVVFTSPSPFHSVAYQLGLPKVSRRYMYALTETPSFRSINDLSGKKSIGNYMLSPMEILSGLKQNLGTGRLVSALEKKFHVRYVTSSARPLSELFIENVFNYTLTGDFSIFSSYFARQHRVVGGASLLDSHRKPANVSYTQSILFDETYINASEDHDLSLELGIDCNRWTTLSYRIGSHNGTTLGLGLPRLLRSIAGTVYLNFKLNTGVHPIHRELRI